MSKTGVCKKCKCQYFKMVKHTDAAGYSTYELVCVCCGTVRKQVTEEEYLKWAKQREEYLKQKKKECLAIGNEKEVLQWTLCSVRPPEEAGLYLVTIPINPVEGNVVSMARWTFLPKNSTNDHKDKWCWVDPEDAGVELDYADEIKSWSPMPFGYALYKKDNLTLV